jgi:uncharacterized protein YndB with AHSA1/START domain
MGDSIVDEPRSENQTSIIGVSRVIDAPAARIFAFLTDPDNHAQFDPSGLVRGSADHTRLSGHGMVFVMDMHHDVKGDYQIDCHVVVYTPNRAIGWAPARPGHKPTGHTFVWRLAPVGENCTLTSQIRGWSALAHANNRTGPLVASHDQLQKSLGLLADAITQAHRT